MGFGEVPLAEVRWLPKGHTIGADKPVVLKKPTRVAILPVGYQNGFGVSWLRETGFWALHRRWRKARKRSVQVNGQKVRLLGPIGASQTILDVTNVRCAAGDRAILELDPMYARGFVTEYR